MIKYVISGKIKIGISHDPSKSYEECSLRYIYDNVRRVLYMQHGVLDNFTVAPPLNRYN